MKPGTYVLSMGLSLLVLKTPAYGRSFSNYTKTMQEAPRNAITYSYYDAQQEKVAIKKIKRQIKRFPSSVELREDMLSPQAIELRNRFLNAQTSQDVENLIAHYERPIVYNSLPADAKFIVLQLATLRPFRGFLWRVRPFFEEVEVTQHIVLTAFKNFVSNLRWFLRAPHVKTYLDYITQPYEMNVGGSAKKQVIAYFKKEEQLQLWMFNEVRPILTVAAKRLRELDASSPLLWDNTIFYGQTSFRDGIDRFKLVGEIERQALIASYELSIARITAATSYSLYGVRRLSKGVGKIVGIDVISPLRAINGLTLMEFREELSNSRYKNFAVKIPCVVKENGESTDCMQESLRMLASSVQRLNTAWKLAKNRREGNEFAFNVAFANADFGRGEMNLINLKEAFSGEVMMRSVVTGEVVRMNIPGLYNNPPRDLKVFMATSFDPVKEKYMKLSNKTYKYRNFFYGSPINWNINAYRVVFPDVRSSKEVMRATRVWEHATSGMVQI